MSSQPIAPRPPGLPHHSYYAERKRHVTRACEKCRTTRNRCDGQRPCGKCRELQVECQYLGSDNRRKADQNARIKALEQRNRYLEGLVEQLSASNSRVTESDSSQGASSSTLDHSRGFIFQVPQYNTSNLGPNDILNICYTGTAAYPTLLTPQASLEAYQTSTVHGLPDEQFAHYAVDGFFRCAATLFFIKTHAEALELLHRVYHDESISIGDMSELCALAAIGSHYDADRVPQEARAVFFYRASVVLNGIIPLESVQGVRVFICLCMNCIMDKSTTARTLIVSALNLARSQVIRDLREETGERSAQSQHRKLLRTLIFLEGWVTYSLGYQSSLVQNEISLIQNIEADMSDEHGAAFTVTNKIQSQMAKMIVMAVDEYKKITHIMLGSDLWTDINRGSENLNIWYNELPPNLHLSTLGETDNSLSPQQVTAIYLMHTLFIDTQLLLYIRSIDSYLRTDTSQDASQSSIDPSRIIYQMPESIFSTYTSFSIQLARIICLLYDQENIFARCWIVIHATFDAVSMMLLSVCQSHFTRWESDIPQIMSLLDSCLQVLRFCSRSDFVAGRFLDLLTPLFIDLRSLQNYEGIQRSNRMLIGYLMNSEQIEHPAVRHILCRLLELMSIERRRIWV